MRRFGGDDGPVDIMRPNIMFHDVISTNITNRRFGNGCFFDGGGYEIL